MRKDSEKYGSLGWEECNDRRASARSIALFRPGLIESSQYRSFCLVRNLSSTGLMATIHAPLEIGAFIRIILSEQAPLSGTVVWRQGVKTGVKFAQEIAVEDLLSGIGHAGSACARYRPPRLQVTADAQFIVQGRAEGLEIKDISQRGLKAKIHQAALGMQGTLVVSGLKPRLAAVRWFCEPMAGFYFIDPLSFDELGQWVLSRHEQNQRKESDD